jgi:transposase
MKQLQAFAEILFYNGFVDFRKRRKSLAGFVESSLKENPFSDKLFIFLNRRRDCVRALYWDKTGFAMWEKELENEKFFAQKNRNETAVIINSNQLEWLLEGVDIWKISTHKSVEYSSLNT